MEQLQYVIEDSAIAYLLGVNNFTNDESAVLELVKNAYDARALTVRIVFDEEGLSITDDGCGMDAEDIRKHWMHVGKSDKNYQVIDSNNHPRILAGSKGVGRFALARLGTKVQVRSKKDGSNGVIWSTDWNTSTLSEDKSLTLKGTVIEISGLREKWSKKKAQNLVAFLSKTYNDHAMTISVTHPEICCIVPDYFPEPILGKNCLSTISLEYNSKTHILSTVIQSDEFLDEAISFCPDVNIHNCKLETDMFSELKNSSELDLTEEVLEEKLGLLGDFSAQMYFNSKPTTADKDKFLYKHMGAAEPLQGGVILYRNAFSITAYEGNKDWLGFGKRSRKSPAGVSHPTGAWRVRENQISGKVEIDKRINQVLQDMSNRQGLEENDFFHLFVEIILSGVKEFERYRQSIVRCINKKNKEDTSTPLPTPVSDRIVKKPADVVNLSTEEAKQLVNEIKSYQKESSEAKKVRETVEERYKYDVRILNVLATVGLKASSIAHEMKNDRNTISENIECIISALKAYGMWETLLLPENTAKAYKNVPLLLETNKEVSVKILSFMDTMLSEIEKRQFETSWRSVADLIKRIKESWARDYAWISFSNDIDEDICFNIAEDVLNVIFDNLILNSIQQNESKNRLTISISMRQEGERLLFAYSDDGVGLDKKYINNPRKILEVHETTRKNGHGLGMWIVNNTLTMTGGEIKSIEGSSGFKIEFLLGGHM